MKWVPIFFQNLNMHSVPLIKCLFPGLLQENYDTPRTKDWKNKLLYWTQRAGKVYVKTGVFTKNFMLISKFAIAFEVKIL